jgi:nitrate reductase molybdenum cofactor assembly chaperone NarJ/NarW
MGLLSRVLERRGGAVPVAQKRDPLRAAGMGLDELRATWIAASWLLSYPDDELLARTGTIRSLAEALPVRPRLGLLRCVTAIEDAGLVAAQAQYVDTFDTRRRGCLYLTYFSQGDTRRRGMALVRIKQDFRAAGVEVGEDELPDHLPLVLEFAAAHDAERGAKILRTNRPGIELLRLHLDDIGSPWHGAADAVSATLPPLDGDDRDAILRLAAEGPDEETVGLDGYGPDDDAAALAARTAARAAFPDAGCGSGAPSGPVPLDLGKGPVR